MAKQINTALIVDDDSIVLQVMQGYLQSKGVENILTAENGAKGKALLAEHQSELQLIMCDIHMPDMNGIEFIEHLRDTECKVPLLMISSAQSHLLSSAEILAGVYKLNLLATLTKPADFPTLDKLLGFEPEPCLAE